MKTNLFIKLLCILGVTLLTPLHGAEGVVSITVPDISRLGSSGFFYSPAPTTTARAAEANAEGVYERWAASTVVVSISVSGVVLECTSFVHGMAVRDIADATAVRWREIYVVRDGKLVLDKVIKPTVTPAVPAKPATYEWEK